MKIKNWNSCRTICFSIIIYLALTMIAPYADKYSYGDSEHLLSNLNNSVVLFVGSPKAYINNKITRIDANSAEVKPVIINGRTLVPVRFIAESLGAKVGWNQDTHTATITNDSISIKITQGQKELTVNDNVLPMDASAASIDGRIFIPLRAVVEAMGKELFWHNSGLIIVSDVKNILDNDREQDILNQLIGLFAEPINYEKKVLSISTGKKTVQVIKVNPKDPSISFEVSLPDGKLNNTEDFQTLVKNKGAFAAINANFFEAYTDIKDPIGHVMSNDNLIFGQSGLTSLGITKDNEPVFSMPGIFVRFYGDGKKQNEYRRENSKDYAYYNVWNAYEVNTLSQSAHTAILYTPARGKTVDIKADGYVLTVRNGIIESFTKVIPPTNYAIPTNGYIVFFGEHIANSWVGDKGLSIGRKIDYEYYLKGNTNDKFKIEDMRWMVSGGPDLVIDSQPAPTSTQTAFSGDRFTKLSTPRTAIGLTPTKQLLLVSVSGATIDEMKEIMLELGAENAINLDGGASTAMYYNNKIITKPGRQLTTIMYIYKK